MPEEQLHLNPGYNLPLAAATPDSNNHGIRPSAEDPKYASQYPNATPSAEDASRVPNVRPRQLYIYNTPPPDLEIRQMAPDENQQASNAEVDLPIEGSSDRNTLQSELPINSGIADIPLSEVEVSSGNGDECDEYFPADAVPTKDSPDSLTYSKLVDLAIPESTTTSASKQINGPENSTTPPNPEDPREFTETPV